MDSLSHRFDYKHLLITSHPGSFPNKKGSSGIAQSGLRRCFGQHGATFRLVQLVNGYAYGVEIQLGIPNGNQSTNPSTKIRQSAILQSSQGLFCAGTYAQYHAAVRAPEARVGIMPIHTNLTIFGDIMTVQQHEEDTSCHSCTKPLNCTFDNKAFP